MAGRILGLARRARSRAAMETIDSASVSLGAGLESDSRGAPGRRQVTVLTRESWEATCAALGQTPPWTTRRANILIEGLRVEGRLGGILRIGELTLEITGETDPCSRMEEQVPGLRAALTPDWRGGVTCRVRSPGRVAVGDAVILDD